jgi:molecular chaperone DnaK (HSP70)
LQRDATREAASLAGFAHVAILAESTAAAVAYGLFVAGAKNVLVFDAGGGTTDCTLVSITDCSCASCRVY